MTAQQFDLFVIGGGSGGVRAARMAAARRPRGAGGSGRDGRQPASIWVASRKVYSHAAHFSETFAEARGFGWTVERHPVRLGDAEDQPGQRFSA